MPPRLYRFLRRFLGSRRQPIRRRCLAFERLESRLAPATDVLTYHNDLASTGVNASETLLTPANVAVNAFGKLFTTPVDGQVYAQPLVDTGVTIVAGPNTAAGAAGLHDVVFVATEHDSLYAFDAAGGAVLWQRSFLVAGAISTVSSGDIGTGDISPEIGITGTPVIDGATGTLYVVAKTKETSGGTAHFVQRLHGISVRDGTDRGTPFLIGDTTGDNTNSTPIYVYGTGDGAVTDPYNRTGKSVVQFNALHEAQRGALGLVNGTLYVQWASHGDNGPYHGWVAKWDVSHLATTGFVLKGVFNTSPNDGLSGVWQGGGRLVFEPDGHAFYFETGNGSGGPPTLNAAGFPANANYNEALVKVVADAATTPAHQNASGWGLKVADYFIPYDVNALDGADSDFGSGAPILLPDAAGISGHPHLIVAGGKAGKLYVLDRDHLGHFDASNDHALNSVPDGSGHDTPPGAIGGLLNTPAWFNGTLIALSGYNGAAVAFTIGSTGSLSPVSQTAIGSFGYLPGAPSISADGTTGGIAWLLDRNANELHAYDAASLNTELWNSGDKPGAGDSVGAVVKFAVPTVANGQVYVGTTDALVVYGLVQPPSAVPAAPTLTATALSGSAVNLVWTDPTLAPNLATSYAIDVSTDGSSFVPAASAPGGTTSLAVGGLQPLTHYFFRITGSNSLGASTPSATADATTTDVRNLLDFTGGFAGAAGLTLNSSAHLNGSRLELTDRNNYEAGSVFSSAAVDVTGFTSRFTFQISPGGDTADGFTFTLQRAGAGAVGSAGGDLGYGGLATSVAVKFDLYNNAGEGTSSTGLFTDGAHPFNAGSIDLLPLGLDLHSGDVFQADLAYDGATLAVTITDTQTGKSATQSYTVNVPAIVGDNSAFVGFTGGTGGLNAVQDLLSWTYSPTATTSPAAPTGLGATPATATAVQLTWTANATNQLGYHLDRATDAAFTQNLVVQSLSPLPNSFRDKASGLAPGNTYYYRLRAFNSVGESDSSTPAQVTIPLAPPKPSAQQVTGVTATEIDLQWQDNAGHHADGYEVLRAANHGGFAPVASLPPTSRPAPSRYTWADIGLTPGTFYEYHVLAYNVSGNNDFAGTNATTLTAPPADVVAAPGDGEVDLSWPTVAGAQRYNVYRGLAPGGEDAVPLATGLTAPSYVDQAVTIGVTDYYTVTAINANAARDPVLPAESAASFEVAATPTPYPGITTGLTATVPGNAGTAEVELAWTAPAGATAYTVYRSTNPGGEGATPLAVGVTGPSFLDTHVAFGTTYYYQVGAQNGAGAGPRSAEASAVPVFGAHIHFTSTAGAAVAGYVADAGLAAGRQAAGLVFGWNVTDTADGVDRHDPTAPDLLRDSFHAMNNPFVGIAFWRLAVPNGTYAVHLLAGDPADTTSLYRLNVGVLPWGGVRVIDGTASAANRWLDGTVAVTVTQGWLYVTSGAGKADNKLDAIDVTPLAPNVTGVSRAGGGPGTSVLLSGADFTGATAVQFGGVDAPFAVLSDSRIRVTVPAGAVTGPITVTTRAGTGASAAAFQPPPAITGLSTTVAAPGAAVYLTGVNLGGTTAVRFHGTPAAYFSVLGPDEVYAVVPDNATSGPITVTTVGGTGASATRLLVSPRLTSFTTTGAAVGALVTLTGANFTGTTQVQFNGLDARFTVLSDTHILAVVPAGVLTGAITVTTPAGTVFSTAPFTAAPRLASFAARSGSPGDLVVLTGVNLTAATAVVFGGVAASFTVDSDMQITAVVPARALTGRITVKTRAGAASTVMSFVVVARFPHV